MTQATTKLYTRDDVIRYLCGRERIARDQLQEAKAVARSSGLERDANQATYWRNYAAAIRHLITTWPKDLPNAIT